MAISNSVKLNSTKKPDYESLAHLKPLILSEITLSQLDMLWDSMNDLWEFSPFGIDVIDYADVYYWVNTKQFRVAVVSRIQDTLSDKSMMIDPEYISETVVVGTIRFFYYSDPLLVHRMLSDIDLVDQVLNSHEIDLSASSHQDGIVKRNNQYDFNTFRIGKDVLIYIGSRYVAEAFRGHNITFQFFELSSAEIWRKFGLVTADANIYPIYLTCPGPNWMKMGHANFRMGEAFGRMVGKTLHLSQTGTTALQGVRIHPDRYKEIYWITRLMYERKPLQASL